MKTILSYAWAVVGIGVILLLLELYLSKLPPPPLPSGVAVSAWPPDDLSFWYSFLLFLQAIGIALIGFGFVGMILETKDWRDYFESRIKDIVIQQDYLQNLDSPTLKNLETSVLKARWVIVKCCGSAGHDQAASLG